MVVPAKTPDAVVEKIGKDIATAVGDPAFRAKLEEQGAQFLSATPAQAQQFLANEDKLWAPLVKASGVKPENCVVFEDSLNGVRAAKAAEMKCIAVPEKANSHKPEFAAEADIVVDSLETVDWDMLRNMF